jgi:DNA processing protein
MTYPVRADNSVLLIAINSLACLRWNEKLALLDRTADTAALRKLSPADVESAAGRPLRNLDWNADDMVRQAEALERSAAARNILILPYTDPAYPPQLREIYDPPFLLFCRGEVPGWDVPALGIVGTRRPSGSGRRAAYELAFEAARENIPVISGLALGIDGEAHLGCLDGGGRTLAVMGNGADTVYPATHRGLASRILDSGGLLVTEFAPGAGVRKYHFPARNRIISGLSRAVLVTEAPRKSGALITADYALEQGRDLFVHSRGLAGLSGAGTRKLNEDGAPAISSIAGILRDWNHAGVPEADETPPAVRKAPLPKGGDPGKTLALFLEEELAGRLSLRRGNYMRRI